MCFASVQHQNHYSLINFYLNYCCHVVYFLSYLYVQDLRKNALPQEELLSSTLFRFWDFARSIWGMSHCPMSERCFKSSHEMLWVQSMHTVYDSKQGAPNILSTKPQDTCETCMHFTFHMLATHTKKFYIMLLKNNFVFSRMGIYCRFKMQ